MSQPASATSADPFTIWEATALSRLGLGDRDDIRSMREELLQENRDWAKVGQRIMLTQAALEKLAAHLKVFPLTVAAITRLQNAATQQHEPPMSEKTAPDPVAAALGPIKSALQIETLYVLPCAVVNPHILVCRRDGVDPNDRSQWVNVRVRSKVNFRPFPAETGLILGRHVGGNLWEFAGNPKSQKNDVPRCPRWPGRW